MYAGGLSYFSGGIFVSGFHVGACPKAGTTAARNARQSSCSSRLAVLAARELRKLVSIWLGRAVTRHAGIRFSVTSESTRFTTCNPSQSGVHHVLIIDRPTIGSPKGYGRGTGVGRGRGEGVDLGAAVAVGVAVAVAVGVGEGVPQGLTGQVKISIESKTVTPSDA